MKFAACSAWTIACTAIGYALAGEQLASILGIVALSSRQVKLLVEDVCARVAPDVVVVYSGNNEFLELHAEKYARVHAGFASTVATRRLRLSDSPVAKLSQRGAQQHSERPSHPVIATLVVHLRRGSQM